MRKVLGKTFFERKAPVVAKDLIGAFLVRRIGRKTVAQMVTEVEAYDGFKDMASHAARGKTRRNEIMFGEAGYIYTYFTYGMHWMLNIVTGKPGYPSAVLIRGTSEINGPARLTKALSIDGRLNKRKLGKATGLWFEKDTNLRSPKIIRTPRIGIGYAGEWVEKKWRFVLAKPKKLTKKISP